MGKKKQPKLSAEQETELFKTFRESTSSTLRMRSHLILLKHQGHSSQYISGLKGYPKNEGTINTWVNRYELLGIEGLKNKTGQGRKRILDKTAHEAKVKEIVKSERQGLTQAKILIEKELDVKMSKKTLTRFLKVLAVSTNE